MRPRTTLLAALAFACAACGTSGTQQAAGSPSPVGSPAVSTAPTSTASSTPTADLSTDNAVQASQYSALHRGPNMPLKNAAGDDVGAFAVAPDGRAVAAVVARPAAGGEALQARQSHMELLSPGADHGEVLPEVTGAKPRGTEGAAATEDAVVWVESSSTDLDHDNWVIQAYDRASHKTRVVAHAAAGDNTPMAPNGTIPYIAGRRVYWIAAQTTGDKTRPARTYLFSRDLALSSPVRREASDVEALTADGNDLYYTKSNFIDPTIPKSEVIIHHLDLRTRADSVVQDVHLKGDGFVSLASAAGDLAWSVTERGADGPISATLTIRNASGAITTITGSKVEFGNLILTPDLLIWTGNSNTGENWLFDRHSNAIVDLGQAPGYTDVQAKGPHIVWRDAAGNRLTATLHP